MEYDDYTCKDYGLKENDIIEGKSLRKKIVRKISKEEEKTED